MPKISGLGSCSPICPISSYTTAKGYPYDTESTTDSRINESRAYLNCLAICLSNLKLHTNPLWTLNMSWQENTTLLLHISSSVFLPLEQLFQSRLIDIPALYLFYPEWCFPRENRTLRGSWYLVSGQLRDSRNQCEVTAVSVGLTKIHARLICYVVDISRARYCLLEKVLTSMLALLCF